MTELAPNEVRIDWATFALMHAMTNTLRSQDPWHKVGAALMRRDHTIAAMGYNGPPKGVEVDWSDRDERRRWMIHAEANAFRYITPKDDVYLLATTMMPCSDCVKLAASYGITEIIYREDLDPAVYDKSLTLEIAKACGITITKGEI